jgi:peptidoglycan/LPS O-acetylase OafA/YrhL
MLSVVFAVVAIISRLDLFIIGVFACVIYYAARPADAVGKLLDSSYMRTLGDWSYSIYLWHAPAHYTIMATLAAIGYPVSKLNLANARLVLFATIFGVVGLSSLSYRYVEVPARRSIRSSLLARSRRHTACKDTSLN